MLVRARPRPTRLIARLEALNLSAARLALRVNALNTALESCMSDATFTQLAPALHPLLTSLMNTSRAVALAVVSRQPGHFAACEVRLRRAGNLLNVLKSRLRVLAVTSPCHSQLEEILQTLEAQLPEIRSALRESSGRAEERAAFSLQLFDLNAWMLRPLTATLNFSSAVEPALVRFTFRLTVLTTLGVLAFKLLHLPHGYWLPFTMVVVLQPDYGATRQRAAQRVLGTATGSLAASALLWVHLSVPMLFGIIAGCVFIFCYTIRRHYAFAIFFVTVFVVLLMEASGPVTAAVAVERVSATVVGGLLAWAAAALFWPLWERERFPSIMAQALRSNAEYMDDLAERLLRGEAPDERVIAAKRKVETANALVFASLRRMFGDPQNRREKVEQSAALANGNQRLTRILNLFFLHLKESGVVRLRELPEFSQRLSATLRGLADTVLHPSASGTFASLREDLDRIGPTTEVEDDLTAAGLAVLFGRAATELSAMTLALEGEALPVVETVTPGGALP